MLKVAAIQLRAGTSKEKNITKAQKFILRAIKNKAKLVCLPELFVFRGKITSSKQMRDIAEDVNGPMVKVFKELARNNAVSILAGSIFEKSGNRKAYNTSLLINAEGRIVARYRKNNLFEAKLHQGSIDETGLFLKGKKSACPNLDGFKIGMSICYDLRFPTLYQQYLKKKADIIVAPSNFTKITGKAHWEILLKARAVENLCYVVAPNQIGKDNRGIESYGHSMIISPWGKILARASGNKEEIIYARIDKKEILRARKRLPGII